MTGLTKTLFLVRHAKSSRDDPRLTDRDRPLNTRGVRDAPEMARRLAQRAEQPEVIVTSPALRASATARFIAQGLAVDGARLVVMELLYDADADALLQVIRALDDRFSRVMLVGHNPGMTDAVNLLTGASIDNVPTCGVATVRFAARSWVEIHDGAGELVDFDFPKREPQ